MTILMVMVCVATILVLDYDEYKYRKGCYR